MIAEKLQEIQREFELQKVSCSDLKALEKEFLKRKNFYLNEIKVMFKKQPKLSVTKQELLAYGDEIIAGFNCELAVYLSSKEMPSRKDIELITDQKGFWSKEERKHISDKLRKYFEKEKERHAKSVGNETRERSNKEGNERKEEGCLCIRNDEKDWLDSETEKRIIELAIDNEEAIKHIILGLEDSIKDKIRYEIEIIVSRPESDEPLQDILTEGYTGFIFDPICVYINAPTFFRIIISLLTLMKGIENEN